MNKNKNFFAELKQNIADEKKNLAEKEVESALLKKNTFEQGLNLTREIMSGSKIKTPRLLVEPGQCKIWERHNRDFTLLNEVKCKDLIDQFKVTGKQEFPGIVRLMEGEGEVKYEIICGARRYWTCRYLGWKYFIEIRELSDEEAFRLADIENRAREDLSDYERAIDYKKALTQYYQNQVQMANRIEVTTSWLSRYLDLADLPEEIVKAYRDITEIKIIHARKLKPFLSDNLKNKPVKEKLLQKALEIKEKGYEGTRVVTELLNATKTEHKPAGGKSRYVSANGLITLHIQKRKDKKLELLIEKKDKATKAEIVEFFATTLDNYL
jgi:ParB family transcriptional regulator, chromosome partitioning protein